jgi:hypothetical protein
MSATADRCKETTTTVGTGDLTLLGAVAGFQSLAAAFPYGASDVMYEIGQGTTEWEVGYGTFVAPATFKRDGGVTESSNADQLVNFSAGTKTFVCTVTACELEGASLGEQIALTSCLGMA